MDNKIDFTKTNEHDIHHYLILGNGFDLVHGLPTQYTDFLEIMKDTEGFYHAYNVALNRGEIEYKWKKYFEKNDISIIDRDNMVILRNLLKDNSWAKYYARCNAEINGWIDFEKEMLPALNMFLSIVNDQNGIPVSSGDICNILFNLDNRLGSIEELWEKYIDGVRSGSLNERWFQISSTYSDSQYGVLKDKMLNDLKDDLDDFIECFRIYLKEIVMKQDIKLLDQIRYLNPDMILSFNYTCTEQHYDNINTAHSYYIHGNANIQDSMVLGVNSVSDDINNDMIYFEKYFQRLRRRIDIHYKDWLTKEYEISIYGHSLDVSDKDIIKPFIENANKVTVFYYSDRDYEKKIINLIKLFSKDWVEIALYEQTVVFVKIQQ